MWGYRLGKVNDFKSYASLLFDKKISYNFNMCTAWLNFSDYVF